MTVQSFFYPQEDAQAPQGDIMRRKALAQSLLQQGAQDPGVQPYAGAVNGVRELLGAYLAKRADKADQAKYAEQLSGIQGQLGLSPDKAKILASILSGIDPAQGREALTSMALQQLQPKPLQFHPATDNAYDEQGNVVHQGAPPPPVVPAGYRQRPDGALEFIPGGPADPKIIGTQAGVRRQAMVDRPMPGHAKPVADNPFGLVQPWVLHGGKP